MPAEKRWIELDQIIVPEDFQKAIGGHPLVAQALYRRGIQSIDAARAYLDPDCYAPAPADELPDFQAACDLLIKALQGQDLILIWGDFDVDGQTATTILVEGLRALGGRLQFHIPVRAEESHGITRRVLESYLHQGFDLLLTCDTGITEHKNIQYVRDRGIPVIVTDHHTLGDSLPPANAIINPQRLQQSHPLRTLPGAGVAYKLIEGLFKTLGETFNSEHYMELAALGIVADVAELKGDTRYLLQKGLINLQNTRRIGLQTLYHHAVLNPLNLDESHIGFQIAPRLNAVGRLGDANPVVTFLTTDDASRARVLATQIEAMNSQRRFFTKQVEKSAENQLQESPDDRHASALVLHRSNWPGGVVGIVASRLVEQYGKPAILLTGENPIHGSARSIEGVNITSAISAQAGLLTTFGGHPMAAGLSLPAENLSAFKHGIQATVKELAQEVEFYTELPISREITLDEISLDFVEQIERLAPFGPGSPALNFLLRDLTMTSYSDVGSEGEHRQVIVSDKDGYTQRFIWWRGGDEPLPQAQFDLVCRLSRSDYRGMPQVSAEWVDFRLSETGRKQIIKRHFEVEDYRGHLSPLDKLKALLSENPGALAWGEGPLPKDVPFFTRSELVQTDTLVIWTAPPSQRTLQAAIRRAQPQRVILFGMDPRLDGYKPLMERLLGLVKYAASQKQGLTALERLAAACAAEENTVRTALKLWDSMGRLAIEIVGDRAIIALTEHQPDPAVEERYKEVLKGQLEESKAYRQFFRTADEKRLISGIYP